MGGVGVWKLYKVKRQATIKDDPEDYGTEQAVYVPLIKERLTKEQKRMAHAIHISRSPLTSAGHTLL